MWALKWKKRINEIGRVCGENADVTLLYTTADGQTRPPCSFILTEQIIIKSICEA